MEMIVLCSMGVCNSGLNGRPLCNIFITKHAIISKWKYQGNFLNSDGIMTSQKKASRDKRILFVYIWR